MDGRRIGGECAVLAIVVGVLCACSVAPDVVAYSVDSGTALTDEDSGETPLDPCQGGQPIDVPESCELPVPWSVSSIDFDPERVNVLVVQGNSIMEYGGGLTSPDDCQHVIHAWYWADLPEFRRIGFCPQTCALVRELGQLAFQFGCDTRPPWWLRPRP